MAELVGERADRDIKSALEQYPMQSTTFPLFAEWLRDRLSAWLK